VDKLATPRRWDIVVFRIPEEPSVVYVFRLVGLPGESVSIREGLVWINGQKQAVPPALAGLEYASEPGLDTRGGEEPDAAGERPTAEERSASREWSLERETLPRFGLDFPLKNQP
jgi:hypothetical protein